MTVPDFNKTHGHDEISIRMLKNVVHPSADGYKLFTSLVYKREKFPTEWEKVNFAPLYKKNDKQSVKCYRPIFLLTVVVKFLNVHSAILCLIS